MASQTSKSRRPCTIKTWAPPGCLRPSRMTPSTLHHPPSPWRNFTESRRAPWRTSRSITREWKFMGVAIAAFDLAIAFLAQFGGPIRLLHVERVMDPTVPDAFKTSYGETINPVKTSRALIMAIIGFTVAVIPALVALPETAALFLDVISLGFGIVAL